MRKNDISVRDEQIAQRLVFTGNSETALRDTDTKHLDFSHPDLVRLNTFLRKGLQQLVVHPGKEERLQENSRGIFILKDGSFALPYPTVLPMLAKAEEMQWGATQFYWDMDLVIHALTMTNTAEDRKLAKGIIGNLRYLFTNIGWIPNGSKNTLMNRSQPFVFAAMIWRIWETGDQQDPEEIVWLKEHMEVAMHEWHNVIDTPYHHDHETGLLYSNGRDVPMDNYSAVAMSGRDRTITDLGRLPDIIDPMLCAMTYSYPEIFVKTIHVLKQYTHTRQERERLDNEMLFWEQKAKRIHDNIVRFLWNEHTGWFHSRDRRTKEQLPFYQLWSYQMLYSGIADIAQADAMVENLEKFLAPFGLAITAAETVLSHEQIRSFMKQITQSAEKNNIDHSYLLQMQETLQAGQWDYPNSWANIEWYLVQGLLRYGYTKTAVTIMENTLINDARFYKKYRNLAEKLNVVTGDRAESGQYEDQSKGISFAWTIARDMLYMDALQHYYHHHEVSSLTVPSEMIYPSLYNVLSEE